MSDAKPVKCQKCGKPIGYVTVVAKRHIAFSATRTKRQNIGPLHGMSSEKRIDAEPAY